MGGDWWWNEKVTWQSTEILGWAAKKIGSLYTVVNEFVLYSNAIMTTLVKVLQRNKQGHSIGRCLRLWRLLNTKYGVWVCRLDSLQNELCNSNLKGIKIIGKGWKKLSSWTWKGCLWGYKLWWGPKYCSCDLETTLGILGQRGSMFNVRTWGSSTYLCC